MQNNEFCQLYTEEGEKLNGIPWNSYPRPAMKRNEWLCLNGTWSFRFDGDAPSEILVPFCPESLLSGYKGRMEYARKMIYERYFEIPEKWRGSRIILHFGAVSRECTVYVNGSKAVLNRNAYLPFSADITDLLNKDINTIRAEVVNDLSERYPYGKQSLKRGGMWYTPVSGIWQSVWLEPVPEKHVEGLDIYADLSGANIEIRGVFDGEIECEGRVYTIRNGRCRIEPKDPKYWSPEDPFLYRFTIKSGQDRVESYFALRTLSVEKVNGTPRICLNGRPYYFNGLLDQGYYSDGLYTPASSVLFENDILRMKSLGFNTLRKHIKIEPQQFYYDCDKLGMIVFQDMVNNGHYSFIRDTIRPTIGLKRLNDSRTNTDRETRFEFLDSMEKTVRILKNHPCVCLWTIFNEGWGQFEADNTYDTLKALDPSRLIDSTSGWFHQKQTDVDSLHIYFGKLKLGKRRGLPQVLSEFGGYVYKLKDHSFNTRKTYGYKIFKKSEEYRSALRNVFLNELVPLAKQGLCASVYTQVSDVEDETNGLLTYDRRVCRVAPADIADIAGLLQKAVNE